MWTTLTQDFRFALRSLRGRWGSTLVAVATLACGLGAAAAIASVVDAVLLRDLAYPRSDQLVQIEEVGDKGHTMPVAGPNFDDLAASQRDFSALATYGGGSGSITSGSAVIRGDGYLVSGDFFRVLGVTPARGRVLGPADRDHVAVVSHAVWNGLLGAPADLTGVTVEVLGERCSVVGVMPAGFAFPPHAAVWIPSTLYPPSTSRTAHNWHVIGRLRQADALPAARQSANALAARLKRQLGSDTDAAGFALTPLRDALVAPARTPLLVLGAGALFLLLIAATNTVNLLMAMIWSRGRELAIRSALGAGASRLLRQVVLESVLITAAATALGLVIARLGLGALVHLAGTSLPRADEIHLDGRIVVALLLVAAVLAIVIGAISAWNSVSRADPAELRESGRGVSLGRGSLRLRAGLLIAQTAVTALLLVGAGLLGRTFFELLQVDPGFQPAGALTVQMSLPQATDDAGKPRMAARYRELIGDLGALPGVGAVGGTNGLPLTSNGANGSFFPASIHTIEEMQANPPRLGYAEYRVASGDYFKAVGIPLERGRTFRAGDGPDALPVALVSHALATQVWGEGKAIGQRIQFGNMDGDMRPLTIVGIVGDVHQDGLDDPERGAIYVDLDQRPQSASDFSVVVRSSLPVAELMPEVRATLDRVATDVPYQIAPLSAVYSAALDDHKFSLTLFGVFAVIALALALGGIYGLMSFAVGERRPEFALRQALGSSRREIVWLVLRRGIGVGLAGLAVGLAAALALGRVMRGLLFGVVSWDPLTLAATALVLLGALALGCVIPARRASAVAPRSALG
jgi:predicted permease